MPKGDDTQLILDRLAETEKSMKDYMEEQIKKLTETVSSLREQLNTNKEVADASMKKADLNEEKSQSFLIKSSIWRKPSRRKLSRLKSSRPDKRTKRAEMPETL